MHGIVRPHTDRHAHAHGRIRWATHAHSPFAALLCMCPPPLFPFLSLNEFGELRSDGQSDMLRLAESIAVEFIGNKAASQVNISSATLKTTQDRLQQLPQSLSLNMFDEAASEIMKVRGDTGQKTTIQGMCQFACTAHEMKSSPFLLDDECRLIRAFQATRAIRALPHCRSRSSKVTSPNPPRMLHFHSRPFPSLWLHPRAHVDSTCPWPTNR